MFSSSRSAVTRLSTIWRSRGLSAAASNGILTGLNRARRWSRSGVTVFSAAATSTFGWASPVALQSKMRAAIARFIYTKLCHEKLATETQSHGEDTRHGGHEGTVPSNRRTLCDSVSLWQTWFDDAYLHRQVLAPGMLNAFSDGWLMRYRDRVNADPEMAVVGDWFTTAFSLACGDRRCIVRFEKGKLVETIAAPRIDARCAFGFRASDEIWSRFL